MQILDDQQKRLDVTLSQKQTLHRVQRALTALGWLERDPFGIVERNIEERQKDGQSRLERPV